MNTPAPSEMIRVGQIEICYRLEAGQADGQLTMFEFRVPSQARVPVPHSHVAYDETIYGLEGMLTWTLDGRKVEVGPSDVLFIRRGLVHQFENLGTSDAWQLSVITPGILGPEYFREMAEVINAGGPPNLERIAAVMQRHGLKAVVPLAPSGPGSAGIPAGEVTSSLHGMTQKNKALTDAGKDAGVPRKRKM